MQTPKTTKSTRPPPPKRICLLAFPGSEMLDAVGPLEVFAKANAIAEELLYDWRLVGLEAGPFALSSGLCLTADLGLTDDPGRIDTVLIAGGGGARQRAYDADVQAWLRRQERKARRLGSVCTGSFVLAAGGYLDGRRAATHWDSEALFRSLFPKVALDCDALYVRDGRLITSAGVTAGIDMALALVEEDYGRRLAFAVARQLVVYARRPGGQSQFSTALLSDAAAAGRFDGLRRWILEHPNEDLRVERLAAQAGMTPRSFARHFYQETGLPPGGFVTRARLETARRALEDGQESLEAIAYDSGFGHAESLRRAFLRHLSMTPGDYRRRWSINSNSPFNPAAEALPS